ncbi:hypothetical protein QQG55_35890 [Brugia pahangi]
MVDGTFANVLFWMDGIHWNLTILLINFMVVSRNLTILWINFKRVYKRINSGKVRIKNGINRHLAQTSLCAQIATMIMPSVQYTVTRI